MGRQLGAPLWPEWFGAHQIEQNIRSPLRWAALYQQVPLDDAGTWVHPDCIQYADESEIPKELNHVVAVDLALSAGKGDFTVFIVAGLDADRNLYIVDVVRHQYTPDNAVHVLFRLAREYELFDVLLDDDPATKVFASLFLELAKKQDGSFPTTMMPTRGKDKETRAAAIRGFFQQRRVFIKKAPWNTELHAELYGFPNAEHDDQVDCLSLIGRRMATMSAPTRRHEGPLLKEVISLDANGRFILNRTLDEMFDERRPRNSIRERL
jgi:predicted phage terminase large subunit-like protein